MVILRYKIKERAGQSPAKVNNMFILVCTSALTLINVIAIIIIMVLNNACDKYEELARKSEAANRCYESQIKILYNEIGEKTKRIAELEDENRRLTDENHGLSDELYMYCEGTGSHKHC